jgi:hypothetical protein
MLALAPAPAARLHAAPAVAARRARCAPVAAVVADRVDLAAADKVATALAVVVVMAVETHLQPKTATELLLLASSH